MKLKRIHLIGVGGIGMSAIAKILVQRGHQVSGSDTSGSLITQELNDLGVIVYNEHKADYVNNCDQVIFSTAIRSNNPELTSARKLGIPTIHRAQALSNLMNANTNIAVAGTHGKTTTTSLISQIFVEAKLEPTVVIGGQIIGTNLHAQNGENNFSIYEADESDNSFSLLNPDVIIINNINDDHLEYHGNSLSGLTESFEKFIQNLSPNGLIIANIDCPRTKTITRDLPFRLATISMQDPSADYYATREPNCVYIKSSDKVEFKCHHNLFGIHNAYNILSAVATALEHNINLSHIQSTLANFQGVKRRFEVTYPNRNQPTIVEDYGHHPTEISMTIKAARESWPHSKIIHIFEPHRFSRTQRLLDELCQSLSKSDAVLVTDIYAASEPIEDYNVHSKDLVSTTKNKYKHQFCYYSDSRTKLFDQLTKLVTGNCVIIFQGAGDISRLCKDYINQISTPDVADL